MTKQLIQRGGFSSSFSVLAATLGYLCVSMLAGIANFPALFKPLVGILLALFVGWTWRADKFTHALSNHGALANEATARVVFSLLRYASPLLILLVMLRGLNLL